MSESWPSSIPAAETTRVRARLGRAWGLALIFLLALPGWSQAATGRHKAEATYQQALRLRAKLESRPQHSRPAKNYIALIRAFQAVYQADPAYEKSPAALACAAQLREEMGWEFSESRYYIDSIKAYQFLIAQYPGSSVSRDALFTIAEIYRVDLNEPDEARRAFKRFLSRYPDSTKARAAREKLKQIDALYASKRPSAPAPDDATAPAPEAESEVSSSESPTPTGEPGSHDLAEVTGVRFWVGSDYTRVVIALGDEVKFSSIRLSHPDRLVFDLSNSRLSRTLAGKTFPVEDGFLRQVRIAQYQPTVTRAVLDVKKIGEYSVFSLPNPFRLVIDIHGGDNRGGDVHGGGTEIADHIDHIEHTTTERVSTGPTPPPAVAPIVPGEPSSEDSGDQQPEIETAGSGRASAATAIDQRKVADRGTSSTPGEAEELNQPAKVSRPPASGKAASARLASQGSSTAAAHLAEPPAPAGSRANTLTRVLGLKIGRIVIDPGHGGHDTGTIGPRGLREKDLVLDVGLRLKSLLERKTDADVVMTRGDDTFIPLEERTAIANQKGADLFISIHANSSRDKSARGIETYYLNFTSDPRALEVAARENASSAQSVHELQSLIKKIVLTEKIKESQDFAAEVQRSVYLTLVKAGAREENRGVKRAPFVVLIGASMPSILAEISFVSNPRDEKLLRRPEYRQKIAEALYQGVERYTRNLGGIRVAEKEQPPELHPTRHSRPTAESLLRTAQSTPAGLK